MAINEFQLFADNLPSQMIPQTVIYKHYLELVNGLQTTAAQQISYTYKAVCVQMQSSLRSPFTISEEREGAPNTSTKHQSWRKIHNTQDGQVKGCLTFEPTRATRTCKVKQCICSARPQLGEFSPKKSQAPACKRIRG